MHITTIGKYTALEAVRTRVPATAVLTLVILLGASLFVRELAPTLRAPAVMAVVIGALALAHALGRSRISRGLTWPIGTAIVGRVATRQAPRRCPIRFPRLPGPSPRCPRSPG